MTTDTLDLPPIIDPAAGTGAALAAVEVLDPAPPAQPAPEAAIVLMRRTTLAELSAVERGIAKLRADHGATDYNINTPKGLQLAKDRRLAVRNVRYQIPHTVKARKAELKEVGEALDAEAERITAALLAIEKPHDDAIKAREQQLADEKAERERKAAEARAKVDAAITRLRGCASRCDEAGMTADRIATGIELVEGIGISADELGDAVPEVEQVRQDVLAAMRLKLQGAQEREAEAARLIAQAEENARQAAELKRQADELAELKRQIAEAQAATAAAAAAAEQAQQDAQARDAGQQVAAPEAADTGKAETLGHDEPEAAQDTNAAAGAAPGMGTQDRPSLVSFDMGAVIGGVARPAGVYITSPPGAATGTAVVQFPESTQLRADLSAFVYDAGPLETSEAEARPWTPPAEGAAPAPARNPVAELLAHLHAGIEQDRFPSHPKPHRGWWDELKALMAAVEGV